MKHWHSTLAAASLGCAAIAITAIAAVPDSQQTPDLAERARQIAERRKTEKPVKQVQAPLRIKAGADGTKPLYGMNLHDASSGLETWEGPLVGYCGPAEIHADGNHKKLNASKSIKTQSGCYYDGKFISIYRNWNKNIVEYAFYDSETWETIGNQVNYTFTSPNVFPSDVTYDPTTKRLYGCFLEETGKGFAIGTNFGYIDLTPELENWGDPVKVIKDLGFSMRGMASTADGTIYGIGMDEKLYTINKINGSLTEIGTINFPKSPTQFYLGYDSAEIDYETGDIYFSFVDDDADTYIVKIDPATAKAEIAANFSYFNGGTGSCNVFSALFFKQTAAPANGTPSKVTNLVIEPDGTELAANITFTMPTLDTDGAELNGEIAWNVAVGERTVGQGTATPGETVRARVETGERGMTTFVVYASASDNDGTPQAMNAFIGNDTPVIGSNPMIMTDGTNVQLIWDAATPEHDGGQMAPVTYKVVRNPDNHVIAEATSDLRINDVIESVYKERYTYTVTPTSGEYTGEGRTSRPFYGGQVFALPHTDDFTDEVLFNDYPSIDANQDYNTWWINAAKGMAVYSGGDTDADDYLCIGPFEMAAGSKYTFEMDADGHSLPENIAVYVGTDKTDGSTYTTEIVPPTFLNPGTLGVLHLTGSFSPAENGRYYFGIQALSPARHQNIYVYNVKVSEIGTGSPAAPENLTATSSGLEKVILKCTLPSKTLGGDNADISSVVIYRDDHLLAEITEGIADGAEFTWTDTDQASNGSHRYNVAAINAAGTGEYASCNGWWGLDRPGMARNFRVYEDIETPGLVHLTWDAPETGLNGGYIDPSGIDWTIDWLSFGPAGNGLVTTGSKCSYDLRLSADACAQQDIIAFSVYGKNYAGLSDRDGKVTRSTYIGPALPLPLRESWASSSIKSGIWAGEALTDDEGIFESLWDITDGAHTGNTPQNDTGMYALSTTVDGGGYRARSPRLAINGESNPTLVFYFMHSAEAKDFYVEAAIDDQPMKLFREISLDDKEAGKWHRIEIPLTELKGSKYFQFGFVGHAVTAANEFCCIDNLSVIDLKETDLTFMGLTGPAKSDVNESFNLVTTIRNSGSKAISGDSYKVRLIRNGQTAYEKNGVTLEPDQDCDITFTDTPSVTDPEFVTFSIEIVCDADETPADNAGGEVEVRVIQTQFPTVRNLSANTASGVTLFWDEPSEDDIKPESVTETFDSYQAFTTSNLGEWTLYDGDGCPTVVMNTVLGVLNYPNIGTPMAWQVIDPLQANILHNAWYARSGEQMLVSFQACADGTINGQSNDWLISPELYGGAQRISFMACSGMKTYSPEIVDIMYSTEGTDPDDFKPVAENVEIPYNANDWTEMMFDIPEGARHFAIVHKSVGKLALLIDDVKYIPAGAERTSISLVGYNVYRDGVKITSEPVAEATYVDTDVTTGQKYAYQVSAMWDKGESPLSAVYTVEAGSGVADISGENIRIRVFGSTIRVAGAEGHTIEVYTAAGMRVASVKAESDVTDINVAPGTYIVTAGGKVAKLMAR